MHDETGFCFIKSGLTYLSLTSFTLDREVKTYWFFLSHTVQMSLVNYILRTASVTLLYVVGFLGGMHILGLVTLYQLFFYTPLWPLVLLYLSWTFLVEWKTPERGGRDLLRNFARRFFLFKYIRDYYPITLIKTSELDPQKNYILGYHPHGIFTEGASMALGTEACGFSEKFPGIIPHLSVHSGKKTRLGYDILMLSI